MPNKYENNKLYLDLTTDEGKKSYLEEIEALRYLIQRIDVSLDNEDWLLTPNIEESIIEDIKSTLIETKNDLENAVLNLSNLYNLQSVEEY